VPTSNLALLHSRPEHRTPLGREEADAGFTSMMLGAQTNWIVYVRMSDFSSGFVQSCLSYVANGLQLHLVLQPCADDVIYCSWIKNVFLRGKVTVKTTLLLSVHNQILAHITHTHTHQLDAQSYYSTVSYRVDQLPETQQSSNAKRSKEHSLKIKINLKCVHNNFEKQPEAFVHVTKGEKKRNLT